ncbi:AraC family transcriptional regulator [Parahaliea mediterranea]|uniref:AraC family transcriptional regulator n=1 Tax=Parahaliea mediterranea TaxID=651086 RepID=UPI001475B448|nr:AraC family transcriptional regulator [Parahaliea mediterranea]
MKEHFTSELSQLNLQRIVYGLNPLVSQLSEQGIDSQALLAQANISANSLKDPAAVMSLEQEQTCILAAIAASNDPGLGLIVGSRYHLSAYGVLGLAMISSRDLIEGLEGVTHLNALTWTRLFWRLLEDESDAILEAREVEPLSPCLHYMIERDFIAVNIMCREMLGLDKTIMREVQLSYPPPCYAGRYAEFFGCPVVFGAEHNRLIFESNWLHRPLPQANTAIHQVCVAQCEEMLERLRDESCYAGIIEYLMVDSSGGFLSLEKIAEKLNASPRTLRRKLAQEGTSYQALLMQVRSNLAKELLLSGKLTVEQIAKRLGYSDSASFCHAFKRWTGRPPSTYR